MRDEKVQLDKRLDLMTTKCSLDFRSECGGGDGKENDGKYLKIEWLNIGLILIETMI